MLVSGHLVLPRFVRTMLLASHPTWEWAVPVASCRETAHARSSAGIAQTLDSSPRTRISRRCRFLQSSRQVETKAKWLPDLWLPGEVGIIPTV
jgi:hypothetical protein